MLRTIKAAKQNPPKPQERMVIGAELYPPTGLKHHGSSAYTEEYYQNPHKTYAHIEEYEKEDYYNNNNNRHHTAYITTPQSTKHGLVSHEGYANYQDNSYGYGGGHAQTHKPAHDSHSYAKYLNGMNHGEGYNGYTQPTPAGYYGHGKGKQMNGMNHNESYETQQYETASYDNYQSQYNLQPHKQKKNWATTGTEWISKGC